MGKSKNFGSRFSFRNRIMIIVLGLVIGVLSLVFTNRMAHRLRIKEEREMKLWGYAISNSKERGLDDPLVNWILHTNHDIPFIVADENLKVYESNLVPRKVLDDNTRLYRKLMEMSRNKPIEFVTWTNDVYTLYYGESLLLQSLVYFPYVQLGIIIIIVVFGYITFRTTKHDEQNRVWIGLAKETAHQLGTPTSSLLGWVEFLRTQDVDQDAVDEINKDIIRLMKVVDRFSKIGSETELREGVVNEIVGSSVLYFRSRVPKNVTISYNGLAMAQQKAMLNEALFEWVIENLLKNALDAMAGTGNIDVKISDDEQSIYIDVRDNGKGIAKNNFKRIFEPGFTTKTRGWGLGLSLSKRIVEGYHKGKIFVLESEQGVGTTIRIVLKKIYS